MSGLMRGISAAVLAGTAVAATVAPATAAPAPAPVTERITFSSTGEQLDDGAGIGALSADGRYVAFTSSENGIVPGDTDGQNDVFVRDTQTGTVEQVNVASDGTQADDATAWGVRISANGRFVAFMSWARNLAPYPQPPVVAGDVFVHDRTTGRTERVSVAPDGGTVWASTPFDISADGRHVAFVGSSKRMEGTAKNEDFAYVVDRRTGAVKRINDALPPEWHVDSVTLSADGSHLAYTARHPRGGRHELWLADLATGERRLVNATPEGEPTNGGPGGVRLSGDGSLVAYISFDEETVPEAPDYTWEQYLYDSRTGETQWITHEGRGGVGAGLLSRDGRLFAYSADDEEDPNVSNVYVRNLRTGRTQLVSRTLGGGPQTEGYAAPAAFADNARVLGFSSSAPDLVTGDTNAVGDGFVRRLR
ncbi:TolB family protein [Streptomyces sp. NPDC060194]|uniref:TolB family protein n=1 Tax=Streptomyces sp. NPDC060194 TaxID=3347069 RepID=UPI003653BCC7